VIGPSFAFGGGKPFCEPLAEIALPAARFVDVVAAVPARVTALGLFVALLVMVSVPVREPAAVGAKVTPTAQVAPTAMLAPQVLVCAKSPEVATPATDAAAVPVFRTVSDCDALLPPTAVMPNVRLGGSIESAGPGAMPVPVRLTAVGPLGSLVEMVSVPVRVPDAVGVNVTFTAQLAPAATLVPQVLVWA
jgi:hypothetical protein